MIADTDQRPLEDFSFLEQHVMRARQKRGEPVSPGENATVERAKNSPLVRGFQRYLREYRREVEHVEALPPGKRRHYEHLTLRAIRQLVRGSRIRTPRTCQSRFRGPVPRPAARRTRTSSSSRTSSADPGGSSDSSDPDPAPLRHPRRGACSTNLIALLEGEEAKL